MIDKKVAIIGGTGKAGKSLVKLALRKGYKVRMLVRNLSRVNISDENLEIVKGNVKDINAINELVKECSALISTLGIVKGEEVLFSTATKNIMTVLSKHKIKRYIVLSGISVNLPEDKKSIKNKILTLLLRKLFPTIIEDKQKEIEILKSSSLEWTYVRVPKIIEEEEIKDTSVSLENPNGNRIGTESLSDYLLKQIEDKEFIRKAPFIYN